MFHAYRSGKQPITARVWRKLEAAERTAGLNPTEPELQSSTLREEVPPYRFTAHESPKATAPTTEERLGRLEGLLERIAVALERMIEKNGGGHE